MLVRENNKRSYPVSVLDYVAGVQTCGGFGWLTGMNKGWQQESHVPVFRGQEVEIHYFA
jgi:hypothetical protein